VASKNREERYHQVAFFEWVTLKRATDARFWLVFHVPNGGHRLARVGAEMKRLGALKGVPDVIGLIPTAKYRGLVAEFKGPKGRVSLEQQFFFECAERAGFACFVWRTVSEAIEQTEEYLSEEGLANEGKG